MQVSLLPGCEPERQHPSYAELATMVQAGGGQLVKHSLAARPGSVDLAIINALAAPHEAPVQRLLNAQVLPQHWLGLERLGSARRPILEYP